MRNSFYKHCYAASYGIIVAIEMNNASNAGSDWKYSSDNNLSNSEDPADCAQVLSKEAASYGIDYTMTTLQLCSYVAADKNGIVTYVEAVVANGKVELQKWWDTSEKLDAGLEDTISVEYTQIQVVYEYESGTSTDVRGDVNADGSFSVADIVMLQKWLLDAGKITDGQAGDLCEDGKLDVFDLCVMKRELLQK